MLKTYYTLLLLIVLTADFFDLHIHIKIYDSQYLYRYYVDKCSLLVFYTKDKNKQIKGIKTTFNGIVKIHSHI